MNDRFKFRIWCDGLGYITSSNYAINTDGIAFNSEDGRSLGVNCSIEQCTGLKDKNGVLIFEGDKLYCIDMRETHTTEYAGIVVFEDFMWIVKNEECDTYLCYYDENNCSAVTEIKIIGNIHD